MCDSKKQWHFYDLLDVLNKTMKFQLNKNITFQLKLSDNAVTLKHCQSHWKYHVQVKLNV